MNAVKPDATQQKAEREALELLRSVDKLVTLEGRLPGIGIGTPHHTLHRALEDIKVITGATIDWHRTHADGTCPDCPMTSPGTATASDALEMPALSGVVAPALAP